MEMSRTPEPDKLVSSLLLLFIERKRASDYIPFLEWKLMGQGNYSNRFLVWTESKRRRRTEKLVDLMLIKWHETEYRDPWKNLEENSWGRRLLPNFLGGRRREGREEKKQIEFSSL